MRWLTLGAGLVAVWAVVSCSGDAAADEATAASDKVVAAEILARGRLEWGAGSGQQARWELETIAGFSHAVAFRSTSTTRVATVSASRQGPDDQLWFGAARLGPGAPVMVFGGAGTEVDEVVVIDADGIQVALDLAPALHRDWLVAVRELPAQWATDPAPALDVVALRDGAEVAREPLSGPDGT